MEDEHEDENDSLISGSGLNRPGKEPLGGCNVTPFAQEKVDRSTLLMDGAIEVDPLAFDFDV
jgi:hypothetical protein